MRNPIKRQKTRVKLISVGGDYILRFDSFKDFKTNCNILNYRVLYIVNDEGFMMFTGHNDFDEFCIKISKSTLLSWQYAVCDFIMYNYTLNIESIIISRAEDLIEALTMQTFCEETKNKLRNYEHEILIHSTTLENWEKIVNDNSKLYSWNYLKETNKVNEDKPIGSLLGDPEEYSDFIMLGGADNIGGEYVVMSKQAGFIKCNDDEEYQPGVRIYLNANKLLEENKLLRDGVHYKVYKSIDLDKYMIDVVKSTEFGNRVFTPKEFINASNHLFEIRNNIKLK